MFTIGLLLHDPETGDLFHVAVVIFCPDLNQNMSGTSGVALELCQITKYSFESSNNFSLTKTENWWKMVHLNGIIEAFWTLF